jgi:hypothetical protein
MQLNQDSVLAQFRQAKRFTIEWRDTLFYSGLFATSLISAKWNLGIPQHLIIYAGAGREFLRGAHWGPMFGSFPRNRQYSTTAMFSWASMLAAGLAVKGVNDYGFIDMVRESPIVMTGALGLSAYDYVQAGGIKKIFAAYRDTLFDYPRKILPPRKPRTNPALAKFKEFLGSLKGPGLAQS